MRIRVATTLVLVSILAACSSRETTTRVEAAPEQYDLVILGGAVYDGTGGPARRVDVAVRGDRIAAERFSIGRFGPKRRLPVSASQRTIEAAKMSVARVTVPSSCSGAMYASFPLTSPSRVVWLRPRAFATPKSATRATPSAPTRMFCGETSR